MRLLAVLLLATNAWGTSCGILPPCYAVTPGLTVVLAEALETRIAEQDSRNEFELKLVPVRMKLRMLIYGKSPGEEFTFQVAATHAVRAGDRFYIEANSASDYRVSSCCISGSNDEQTHGSRVQYFRELSAGQHRETSLQIHVREQIHGGLEGVSIGLSSPSDSRAGETDNEGRAEWKDLLPGRYNLLATKQDYLLVEPAEALAAVEIVAGACLQRFINMEPRFKLSGIVRTPDGKPGSGIDLRLEQLFDSAVARTASDALGQFTFFDISPGEYTLVAGDGKDNRSPYPTTYYPGCAGPRTLRASERRWGHAGNISSIHRARAKIDANDHP